MPVLLAALAQGLWLRMLNLWSDLRVSMRETQHAFLSIVLDAVVVLFLSTSPALQCLPLHN